MEVSITKISENGQIVIPSEIRKDARIKPKTKFLVINKGGNILLKQLNKKALAEEARLMRDIIKGEKDILEGRYTVVNTDMSPEEIDEILMKD